MSASPTRASASHPCAPHQATALSGSINIWFACFPHIVAAILTFAAIFSLSHQTRHFHQPPNLPPERQDIHRHQNRSSTLQINSPATSTRNSNFSKPTTRNDSDEFRITTASASRCTGSERHRDLVARCEARYPASSEHRHESVMEISGGGQEPLGGTTWGRSNRRDGTPNRLFRHTCFSDWLSVVTPGLNGDRVAEFPAAGARKGQVKAVANLLCSGSYSYERSDFPTAGARKGQVKAVANLLFWLEPSDVSVGIYPRTPSGLQPASHVAEFPTAGARKGQVKAVANLLFWLEPSDVSVGIYPRTPSGLQPASLGKENAKGRATIRKTSAFINSHIKSNHDLQHHIATFDTPAYYDFTTFIIHDFDSTLV
ncbi:hypothetical protein AC578_1350 [Pseudocercospora eumusae]|uniref:Uncharacterized protein n=1 Tax=Pseudocercospora eumusae TaxID=321146 RepID=A0A139HUK0_9PEZI|nr:hypothetical protein AC578_1350 [Pseudocercospora eumusae]